jgi:hypothetical protein
MLETNGIPPKLTGRESEELICQQYWQEGKLVKAVDVLYIKSHGRWSQLYFENCTIFWRSQEDGPAPYDELENDRFKYPLIDLGNQYQLRGEVIADCEAVPMVNGAKVSLIFERGDKVVISCVDNETRIQYIKAL